MLTINLDIRKIHQISFKCKFEYTRATTGNMDAIASRNVTRHVALHFSMILPTMRILDNIYLFFLYISCT